jgi:hypothetical protein
MGNDEVGVFVVNSNPVKEVNKGTTLRSNSLTTDYDKLHKAFTRLAPKSNTSYKKTQTMDRKSNPLLVDF